METKESGDDMSIAICLPGYSIEIPNHFPLLMGEFNSLETQDNKTYLGRLLQAHVEVNQTKKSSLEYQVQLKSGGQFCKGDSGSGFIAFCPGSRSVKCLYGVLSRTLGTSDSDQACGSQVVVAATTHLTVNDLIRGFMSQIEGKCY